MSQALKQFIEAWNSHHDAARLIEDSVELPNAEDALAYLDTLSSDERNNLETTLTEAMLALEKNLVVLKLEQGDVKRQLDQHKKLSEACQSYARNHQKIDLSE
jgi:hypothetical protein